MKVHNTLKQMLHGLQVQVFFHSEINASLSSPGLFPSLNKISHHFYKEAIAIRESVLKW
uniref:Uncharacterized protein n=1 Tax=Octopus bimaculoides TaxID=37653 RepID=A0A0L8GM00_OCTBM